MAIASQFPSIKPSLMLDFANTKSLDPRITFTRASTGTYYDGVTVAKAEENLLKYSQEFDNAAWVKQQATVTANAGVAPDGTSTADTLTANTGNARHWIVQSPFTVTNGLNCTLSCYVKAGTNDFVSLNFATDQTAYWLTATATLSTGTITKTGSSNGTLVSSSITSVGNGWYRLVITGSLTNGGVPAYLAIILNSSGTPTYGDYGSEAWNAAGTETVFIWGAQLEQRSSVTAYTATTTQPITNYIPVLSTAAAGQPRFDHNPTTGESLGLRIEEQRTNLFTYSSDFSNAAWTKTALNLTSNTIVAPDGTLTGSKISSTTGTWISGLISTGSLSTTSCSISIYAKAGEAPIIQIATYNFGNFQCYFDLTNGTSSGTAGFTRTMTLVGNGWYRCTVSGSMTAGGNFVIIPMSVASGLNAAPAGQGIYIWGAQLEAGSFPTSYIPTVASQVTRSADAASMTGTNFSSWYNNGEGAIYTEITPVSLAASSGVVINDNTTSNRIRLAATSTTDQGTITSGGTAQATLDGGTPAANTNMKLALAYNVNDFALSLNGATVATDTSGTVPLVTQLQIGAETTTIGNLTLKKVAYYPKRLTNSQLQAITA